MYNIKDFKPRIYQETILNSALLKNLLIVLPTGMGKTKTAILIAINRLNNYPESKILFLTPTKPLASQICNEFQKNTTVEDEKIILFTGAIAPDKRQEQWNDAKIIVSTPQTAANDIINGRMNLKKVSCLIIDEAHLSTGDYDYCFISKQYHHKADYEKIIGLTASPGDDMAKITKICSNLYIEAIEVRSNDDPDVKPYVQELSMEYIYIDLPQSFKEIKKFLAKCLKTKFNFLNNIGYKGLTEKISKKEILNMQKELQGRIARGEKDFSVWKSLSLIAEVIKVKHAIDLLETQGIYPLFLYMEKLCQQAEKTKTKATKNLVKDINFKSAFALIQNLANEEIEHPKQAKLREILSQEIGVNKKIIIFTQYRDSAKKIVADLNHVNGVNAKMFVGQAKKRDSGMTQKKQIEMLQQFREGDFNTIVMTSVGELGLDIPSVDLVIFYEPVPSAIRQIQRRGRTARHSQGKVQILVTKNTIDEAYKWAAYHKEKRMYNTLKELKNKFQLKKCRQPTLDDFAPKEQCIKMIADSRERGSGIIKHLAEKGIGLNLKNIHTADFIVGDNIGIERKTVQDFVNSIIDKRLLVQIKNLKNNFASPLLIIEGSEDIYSARNIHPNAIRGMLASIALSFGVPMIYTADFKDTAELLILIAKKAQKEKKEFGLRFEKKPLTTMEMQEYIVESLPGVGPSLAKSLLKNLKTIKNIVNAEHGDLKDIEKIGSKKAKEIKRIVEEEYKGF
ncbi:MAG: DEAD/DEAH box helicase [Nanoarchaeota archaeon]|nr:DEAD/DEAH box helicase [Nanoarchaeota archaeon]